MQVDPNTFKCTVSSSTSPSEKEEWSNSSPQVSLTHMYCGQISYAERKATGVHALDADIATTAQVKVSNRCDALATFPCFKDVEVWDKKDGKFIKKAVENKFKYFFPDKPANLVKLLTTLVNHKQCKSVLQNDGLNCISVSFNNQNKATYVAIVQMNGKGYMKSAWPIRPSELDAKLCSSQCKVNFTGK